MVGTIVRQLTDGITAEEAEKAGQAGVSFALEEKTGIMVSFVRRENTEMYDLDFEAVDVNQVCNQEKTVPLSWIEENGNDIKEDYMDYVLPLIQGGVVLPMKDGVPDYLYRKVKFFD